MQRLIEQFATVATVRTRRLARCQQTGDRRSLRRIVVGVVVGIERHGGQQRGVVRRPCVGVVAELELALDGAEVADILAASAGRRTSRAYSALVKLALVVMTWSRSGVIPSRERKRRSSSATSAPAGPAVQVRLVDDQEERSSGLSASHCRVESKTGRSSGRISMYSSIE